MTRRRIALGALIAVVGPGLLAGLSDDDPAGITTYSVLGAEHGYQFLWVLALSTVALVLFHSLGARMGVATGQGIIGLVRHRYGVGPAAGALTALVVANIGTTCAEFAGVAAGCELFGIPRGISVPVAAIGVSLLVLRGSFHRVEHILIGLSTVFIAYIASGVLADPDWGAAAKGLVVPTLPTSRDAIIIVTATLGTTLAPWGLAFIQSYAVDKRLRAEDLRYERIDVATGAILTGVIGFFIVVACAATIYRSGQSINDASDAARALEPLAGDSARTLFGIGLIGAAILAASILPLSTSYSVSEFIGVESALDDRFKDARPFYLTYVIVTTIAAAVILIPAIPLITILVSTQVLNAVLLIPLLIFMVGIGRDEELMGELRISRTMFVVHLSMIAIVLVCIGGLFVSAVS